jgi:hypothetical protein
VIIDHIVEIDIGDIIGVEYKEIFREKISKMNLSNNVTETESKMYYLLKDDGFM